MKAENKVELPRPFDRLRKLGPHIRRPLRKVE